MNQIPKELYDRFISYISTQSETNKVINSDDIRSLDSMEGVNTLINLNKVNSIRWINKFHENVNKGLVDDGYYISCASTLENRILSIKKILPFKLGYLLLFFDFIFNRVIPKLPILKRIYFIITQGRNRIISKTEILGRLISCGFQIVKYFEYDNLLYVISKKINSPSYDNNASYGPLFKMKRIGHNGKPIFIYKFRTMHPYSEFLQEELYNSEMLEKDGDKIKDDFRITVWGKYFRRFWIDELPQLYNLLKGDLSLVGVRAVSNAKFKLFDEELQKLRIKVKPGLLPPFYSDLPKNFKEFQESERKYLLKKIKSPISTDIKYFISILKNIIFKGARSK